MNNALGAVRISERMIDPKQVRIAIEHQDRTAEVESEIGEHCDERSVFVESSAACRKRFRIPHISLRDNDHRFRMLFTSLCERSLQPANVGATSLTCLTRLRL